MMQETAAAPPFPLHPSPTPPRRGIGWVPGGFEDITLETSRGIQHGWRQMLGVGAAMWRLQGGCVDSWGPEAPWAGCAVLPLPPLPCLPALSQSPLTATLSPQRDLDFTIDLDFKGQLCELSCSTDYRMR